MCLIIGIILFLAFSKKNWDLYTILDYGLLQLCQFCPDWFHTVK